MNTQQGPIKVVESGYLARIKEIACRIRLDMTREQVEALFPDSNGGIQGPCIS